MMSSGRRNSQSKTKYRTRRDSGTKLDYYHDVVQKTILEYQVHNFILTLKIIYIQTFT
jgi:hypothetical protein